MNDILGQRIKDKREEIGITQEELAKKLGLNKSTIQRYETNSIKKIKLPIIEAIAKALRVNASWLVGKSTDPFPSSSEPQITKQEGILLDSYRSLNAEGQEKLLGYADDLSHSGKYEKNYKFEMGKEA